MTSNQLRIMVNDAVETGDGRHHLGSLPEPMQVAGQWAWVLFGRADVPWLDCSVNADQFRAMAAAHPDAAIDGYAASRAIAFPTRHAALRAAADAGLPVADHQYAHEWLSPEGVP